MSPCIYSIAAKLLILKHSSHFGRIGHCCKKSRQELFVCSSLELGAQEADGITIAFVLQRLLCCWEE